MVDTIAGIETGGTKVICAVAHASDPRTIISRITIPTREPVATLQDIANFLDAAPSNLTGIGIASFGPLDLDRNSASFGHLTSTPKLGWEGIDILGAITDRFSRAGTEIVTDVGGSALGEARWGAGASHDRFVYLTVGTGIGAGFINRGRLVAGSGWPEIAHTIVRRHPDDMFPGNCPFHGDCLEGLAAGPAITARWGFDGPQLDPGRAQLNVQIISYYIAQLFVNLAYTLGTEYAVVGGGVSKTAGLLPRIEAEVSRLMGPSGTNGTSLKRLRIALPALGDDAGVLGALSIAQYAANKR